MSHRFTLTAFAAAALLVPGVAQADSVSTEVELKSTVNIACGMGSPDVTEIDLLDLTGPDGKLASSKTGTATLGTAKIADAWCNAPHRLSMRTWPMALERATPYAQSPNMARKVTFTALLVGMSANPLGGRPAFGGDLAFVNNSGPRAAGSSGLELNISELQTLSQGNTEQPLMLEAGSYRGRVTITLSVGS